MASFEETPLVGSILRFVDRHKLFTLPLALQSYGKNIVFPILVAFVVLCATVSILQPVLRMLFPASAKSRYRNAKMLYREGKVSKALQEWEALKRFGPAYLSRATHALYVEYDPLKALGIFRVAKQEKVKINLSQVEMMKLDAQALQAGGNARMVAINRRLAKQDHLGIVEL